ncbi:MAG: hypothetical protein BWX61_01071 [Bacteroidetes bacterium ADurb.Bin035]|nr:MAG: hypothetical protein BWX61_01071 [Bacteroidetes bacterium ADurb.Bin035]
MPCNFKTAIDGTAKASTVPMSKVTLANIPGRSISLGLSIFISTLYVLLAGSIVGNTLDTLPLKVLSPIASTFISTGVFTFTML